MSFRINTGGRYVRKSGSNANDGLTTNTPKATISAGMGVGTGALIVLSGRYTEAPYNLTFVGDGIVEVVAPQIGVTNVMIGNITNGVIRGFNTITCSQNAQFANVRFIVGELSLYGSAERLINCELIGLNGMLRSLFTGSKGNKLFNCKVVCSFIVELLESYVDEYSVLDYGSLSFPNMSNACIRGIIKKGGINYVVPQAIDIINANTVRPFAERQGVYPASAQEWLHVGMSITANQCYSVNKTFNADPQFNDVANYDFTVAPTSPFIDRLGAGQNLCGVKVATPLKANIFAKTNLSGTNDLTVESPNTSGFATSPVITVDPVNARTLGTIQYVGALNFDALATGGTATNDNVPKATAYTKNGQAVTATSPRPSVMIRWSTRTDRAPDANTNSDWGNENVNGVLPGEWVLAELNTDFLVDSQGWGNGDQRFNPLAAQAIQATYYQIRVTLTDAYNNG